MALLQGKTALITGGASGIGAAAAEVFVREKAAVVIADRDAACGQALVRKLTAEGAEILFLEVDVSDRTSVDSMIGPILSRFGRLDCAFNNAGIPDRSTSMMNSTQENWDRIMAVNLEGLWHCMKAEIAHMLEGGGGAIVNNASRTALRGVPSDAIYGAAKHGVLGLTRAAAVEFAARDIRVNAICPGLIETPLAHERFGERIDAVAAAANPMGRMALPSEVAEAAAWLCSNAASFVTGIALPIDGGATAR